MSLIGKYHKPQANQGGDFRPWLNKEELNENGTVFVVDELREAPANMNCDLLLDVTSGKKEFTLSVYAGSVLLTQLVSVLGENEKKWKRQQVKLYVAKGKYINATDPKTTVTKKRPMKRTPTKRKRS